MSKRKLFLSLVGTTIVIAVVALLAACWFFPQKTLTIQNETEGSITIQVDTWTAIRIESKDQRTLVLERLSDPHIVYIFAPMYQECSWSDAKSHEPLIVSPTGANCTNIRSVPTP
jgi:hypothetical protein